MGYAAARYGHVMFPENVNEPALDTAELLLEGVGKGDLSSKMLPFFLKSIALLFWLKCLYVHLPVFC